MNPETVAALNAEKARLGRELTQAEVAAITEATQASGDAARGATRERARLARAEADESNATDRSGGVLGEFAERLDRATGGHPESMLAGVTEGASLSFGDELAGAARNPRGAAVALSRLLGQPTDLNPENTAALGEYEGRRDEARRWSEEAAAANPLLYGAGALAGGTLTAPLTPALRAGSAVAPALTRSASALVPRLAAAGRGALPRLGAAATTGAGYAALGGAGASEADAAGGVAADAAREAPVGFALGSGLGLVGEGVGAARRAAPAVRDWADRALLAVPGGNPDRLARAIGGGRRAAAEAVRGSRLVGPGSTSGSIAEEAGREIAEAAPTSLERLLASHPEGGVDPRRIADTLERVVAAHPNPSERASMTGLRDIIADMRSRGGNVPVAGPRLPPTVLGGPRGRVPEFIPGSTRRPSPAPDEMIAPTPAEPTAPAPPTRSPTEVRPILPQSDPRRTGRLGVPVVSRERTPIMGGDAPPPAPEATPVTPPPEMPATGGARATPAGRPGARRGAPAAPPPERHDPAEFALTLPPHLAADPRPAPVARPLLGMGIAGHPNEFHLAPGERMPSPVPGSAAAEFRPLPERVSTPLPDAPPPRTRPREERPLGAREMAGAWASPPPPVRTRPAPPLGSRPRTIPFSGPTRRTPDTAMHVLDERLGDLARYGEDRPGYVVDAAREGRSAVRRLLDSHAEGIVGPEAVAANRAARNRAHVAMAIRDAADPAASREVARGIRPMGVLRGVAGGLAGHAAAGVPGAVGGAATALAPEILSGAVLHHVPALTAAGTGALARGLESNALGRAAAGVHTAAPAVSGVVGRAEAARPAAETDDPLAALPRRPRRVVDSPPPGAADPLSTLPRRRRRTP